MLRLDDAGHALLTHTGQAVSAISGWWLDDAGQLYAMASQGPGVVLDRDLPPLMERLVTEDGGALLDAIDRLAPAQSLRIALPGVYDAAPLRLIDRAQVPGTLGFQANPTA